VLGQCQELGGPVAQALGGLRDLDFVPVLACRSMAVFLPAACAAIRVKEVNGAVEGSPSPASAVTSSA
jgi:hypothetical protein